VRGVQADAPVLCGRAIQGGLLFGESDWEIGGARAVQSGGLFVIGLPMDAAPDLRLAFEKNGVKKSFDYKIVPREYKEQRINVDDKFIKYPPEVERRIISESEKITAARSVIDTSFAEFMNLKYPFAKKWPTSGVYGSRRIFNGIPKAPHKGWDIAAPAGTPVLAVAAGRVALVIDSYMSGKTIIIDHGFSLYSVYAHLSKISIENGAVVRAGDAIGAVGRTGRASGAHLHLGLYFGNEAIDPELMVRD
jgi:murein DD-endopeptidase MepM/ murein hydrolase activator NlpD